MIFKFVILLFSVILFNGCSNLKHRPESLIKPWSDELARSQPFSPPFVATYHLNEKTLVFVAIAHENKLESKSFEAMRKVFGKEKFGIVIAEGFPTSWGTDNADMRNHALSDGKNGFFKGEESNYAIVLATKNKTPFVGGEPDTRFVLDGLQTKGYSSDEFFNLSFLQRIAQLKRGNALGETPLSDQFEDFKKKSQPEFGPLEDISFSKFKQWYQENNKVEFEISNIDSNTAAPKGDGTLYTQQLSAIVGQIRDEHIFSIIKDSLSKYKNVVIIYGAGHWSKQKLALEAIMGKPKIETALP